MILFDRITRVSSVISFRVGGGWVGGWGVGGWWKGQLWSRFLFLFSFLLLAFNEFSLIRLRLGLGCCFIVVYQSRNGHQFVLFYLKVVPSFTGFCQASLNDYWVFTEFLDFLSFFFNFS